MEMPGLRITIEQASRLWGVDTKTCRHLMDALVTEGFLVQTVSGAFRRTT